MLGSWLGNLVRKDCNGTEHLMVNLPSHQSNQLLDKLSKRLDKVRKSLTARNSPLPRVVMTLLVRDEADIIESNVRFHYGNGVDQFVITDNGSTDGTVKVLERLATEIPIVLRHEQGWFQSKWVTDMARFASRELHADWIINADADEFFVCRKKSLKAILAKIPAQTGILEIARHDFVPIEPGPANVPVPAWMIYRRFIFCDPLQGGSTLIPKVIHRADEEVCVEEGNHAVQGPTLQGYACCPQIEIFHYPVRSYPQFESKTRNVGSGFEMNKDSNPEHGIHARHRYELLKSGLLHEDFLHTHFYDQQRLKRALKTKELVEDQFLSKRLMADTTKSTKPRR